MNPTEKAQLLAELRVMDITKSKPNYASLAREYHLDYRTVKKYHNGYEGKPKTRKKTSKLDRYKEVIKEKLSIPRTTRKGVYEFLTDRYGEDQIGSYSNFKTYCRKNKLVPVSSGSPGGGNTRYETKAGDMAQCDWKEKIILTSKYGEVFTINIFHLVLKFSRYSYIEMTFSMEQPTVFRCLTNAFRFFGGVPERILFDNMSTVMDTNVYPKRVNYRMAQFAKDMNFKVTACKARHAYTKGTNEARNKIMDWLRCYSGEFETVEELAELVDKLNVKMNTNICEGTDVPPCILFLKEKEYLNPLPDRTVLEGYLTPEKSKVSRQQLARYKGSQYSVDRKYIGEYVGFEEFEDKLLINYNGKTIKIHSLSKNPINYDRKDYEQTLSGQLKKNSNFDDIVADNLAVMDRLLESRRVNVTKEDALRSYEHMVAYLMSHGSLSNWIRRFLQTLNAQERQILYEELSKLLPYVYDEEQFFQSFRYAASKKSLKTLRVEFWGLDTMGSFSFLTEEGSDRIYSEFEKETAEYLQYVYEAMG